MTNDRKVDFQLLLMHNCSQLTDADHWDKPPTGHLLHSGSCFPVCCFQGCPSLSNNSQYSLQNRQYKGDILDFQNLTFYSHII